jgi:hypothetical protein
MTSSTPFSQPDIGTISYDDEARKLTIGGMGVGSPFHFFEFNLSKDVAEVNVSWNGKALYDGTNEKATMYFYDQSKGNWMTIDKNTTKGELTLVGEAKLGQHIISPSYILYIAVVGTDGTAFGLDSSVETDYVKVTYRDRIDTYPEGVSLDVGDDSSADWTRSGTLDGKATFSGPGFLIALESQIQGKTGDVTIILAFTSQNKCELYISNLSISYNLNTPPQVEHIYGPFHVKEDCGEFNLNANLADYFSDDGGLDKLEFKVHGGSQETVDMTISETNDLLVTPAPNFYGDVVFNISATDWGPNEFNENGGGDDATTYSNDFIVRVEPQNDAPAIVKVGSQTPSNNVVNFQGMEGVEEDCWFNISVEAVDIDGDELTFGLGDTAPEGLSIDPDLGFISYHPGNDAVGTHEFKVTVTEINGSVIQEETDHVMISLEVVNVNDNPVISSLELNGKTIVNNNPELTLKIYEDAQATIDINFNDVDVGDKVTLDCDFNNPRSSMDAVTGEFTFLPVQEDVGRHQITFTAKDDNGGKGYARLDLEVVNVNDPPVAGMASFTGGEEDPLVIFTTQEAVDEDGDQITYTWDFGDGSVPEEGLEVQHVYSGAGPFAVVLTVSDGTVDIEVPLDIEVTLADENETIEIPPEEDPQEEVDDPENNNVDNSSSREASSWWLVLLIIAILIFLAVAVVVVVVLVVRRKKANDDASLPQPQPIPLEPAPSQAPYPQQIGQEGSYRNSPYNIGTVDQQAQQPPPEGNPP